MKILQPLIIAVCASLLTAVNLQAAAPTITTQPVGKTLKAGTNYTMFVKASTNAAGYVWYKGTNATTTYTTNYAINDAKTTDSGSYTVVITNSAGEPVTSDAATITVLDPISITTGLVNTNIGLGTNATLTVTASGSSPTYSWTKNTAALASTTSSCAVDSSVAGSFKYIVKITNAVSSVTSTATVNVVAIPVISKDLTNKFVAVGSNATFTVTATNTMGTYQWYFNATNTVNCTTNSYTISSVAKSDAGKYSVVLNNLAGSITSAVSTVVVQKYPAITNAMLVGTNAAAGTNYFPVGAAVTLSVLADGDSIGYQWQKDAKNVSSTTATNTIASANVTNSGKYTVIITNAVGKVTSSNVLVTVIPPPTIKTPPAKQTVVTGSKLTLTVSASGTTPYTNLWYQWTLASTNITAATNSTFIVTNANNNWAGDYRVIVTNFGGATTSAVATITVKPDTNPPTLTVTVPSKAVTNAALTLTGTVKDAGNVPISNVWCYVNITNNPDLTDTNAPATTTNSFAKWSKDVTLAVGTNNITVVAADINGTSVTNKSKVVYAPFYNATVTINGSGVVAGSTNKVQWGTTYTFTAKPDARNLFINWSGVAGISTTNSTNSTVIKFTPTNTVAMTVNFATNKFFGAAGTYNGLFSGTNAPSIDNSGFLTLTVTTNLTYSGKSLTSGKSFTLSGTLDTNGTSSATLASGITLAFGINPGSQQLTGSVYSGSWTSVLSADINYFTKTNPATNFSGSYTVVIPPGATGPATNGYGYAVVTVSTNGTVTVAGAAADGSAISQTAPISKDGYFPMFVQLYALSKTNTAGFLGGWWHFATNGVPTGPAVWVKTSAYTNGTLYTAGLTNSVTIQSSKFVAPTRANPMALPGMILGSVDFSGGNLTNDIGAYILMATDGTVYSSSPSISVKMASSGLLSGKFTHNATGKSISFSGVVMQNATNAFGYFAGTNACGSVVIDSLDF